MPTFQTIDPIAISLRERLLARPRSLHLKHIADEMDVSPRWLDHLIAGHSRNPSKALLKALDETLKNHNL